MIMVKHMNEFISSLKTWSFENLPEKLIGALPHIISFILIIVIGFWLSGVIGKLLVKILESHNVDSSMHRFLRRSCEIFFKIIFFVIALEQIGISINSFVTAIGAAGITAGLGLQNSISQFAGGIQILFNKPFKSGDYIEVDGFQGKVKEIRFMHTTLITNDNKIVVVPNLNITSNSLVNYSTQGTIRMDLLFFIGYDDDIDKAKKVLMGVATSNNLVCNQPKPVVNVAEHGASGVGLYLFAWCESTDYWTARFQLQEEVKKAFDRNDITIPYNQLDVHIDN